MTRLAQTLWASPDGHNIESVRREGDRIVTVITMAGRKYAVDLPAEGVWKGGPKLLRWSGGDEVVK